MAEFAIVRDGFVINTIVAEPSIIPALELQADHIRDISELTEKPSIGWMYDSISATFVSPYVEAINDGN